MSKYYPLKDKNQHDYINKMTVIIARLRLMAKDIEKTADNIQNEVERNVIILKEKKQFKG